MHRIIPAGIAATVATAALAIPAPAHAEKNRVCDRHAGNWREARFCLVVKWKDRPHIRVNDVALRMSSPHSDGELGYLDMHNIDVRVTDVVSGRSVHGHDNGRTGGRSWSDSHLPIRARSGYVRVTVDYTVGWGSFPFGFPDTRANFVTYLR